MEDDDDQSTCIEPVISYYSPLTNRGVKEIRVSPMDTIESSSLYSDYAYNNGEEDKHVKFLVGAYFTEDKKLIKK